MADIAQMIYNYNPSDFYLKNRAQDLENDKMNMANQRTARIMGVEDQILSGDLSGWNKMQVLDPQRAQNKYLSDAEQLKLGSRWAGAFRTLAPENKARAYAQFIKAAPGMGIDVSDMPQSYIPEESDAFIEQLANAGIDEASRYSNEMAERRQQEAFAQQERMARLQNELAMQRQQALGAAGGAGGYGNTQAGLALRIAENPDNYTPEQQMWAINYLKSGDPRAQYDVSYNRAMGAKAGERAGDWAGKEERGYYKEGNSTFITPGSDAEMEYMMANRKVLTGNEVSARAAQTVLDDISAMKRIAKEHPFQVASWGSKMSLIPGTPSFDFAARVDSIRGNAAVDQLLNIKQSGAGLGQVPQQQLNMLADMTGNLDRAQSYDELMDVINRFERIYTGIRDKANTENRSILNKIKAQNEGGDEAYAQRMATYEQDSANQELSVGTVEDGYRFKGGNPADKNNWEKVK